MRFSDLRFQPHRHNKPGKTHARAMLANGSEISVVHWPTVGYGPDDAPYEIQSSILPGKDDDGIFYAHTPEEVETVMAQCLAVSGRG